jgi:mannose-6-phosphate isomerase
MAIGPVLLDCVIQPYAWGSHTAISRLLGVEPPDHPEAELWIGAHPNAPSRIKSVQGTALAELTPLDEFVAHNLDATLGPVCRTKFGDTLPFLLKVLAADAPLSLQAHPSREQAQRGFDHEELLGVAMSDPTRVFKDRNHKPELICALTKFIALCGFRPVDQTAALFERLGTPKALGVAARLRVDHPAMAIRSIVADLLTTDREDADAWLGEIIGACRRLTGSFFDEADLAADLADAYPGDVGAIISLLLNRVVLQPGEALVLPAGNLHAYIRGVGVELMANSDNVLRGGLTPKHVDVEGLMEVLDWNPLPDPVHRPPEGVTQHLYPSPSDEFRLERIELSAGLRIDVDVRGPELLWCETGSLMVSASAGTVELTQGASGFIPAETIRYELSGNGVLFRSTIG